MSSNQASPTPNSNPFTALITQCNNNPSLISTHYNTHRTTRPTTQRPLLLSHGITPDPILASLLSSPTSNPTPPPTPTPTPQPAPHDPRHNLTIWARPPLRIKHLISTIQSHLRRAAPGLYCSPAAALHMTVCEVASARTPEDIEALLVGIKPVLPRIEGFLTGMARRGRTAGLGRARVVFDTGGVAVSLLPVADTAVAVSGEGEGDAEGDAEGQDVHEEGKQAWGYHHLRRDVYDIVTEAVPVASRYVVPSAHLTIARFVAELSSDEVRGLIETIEGVNMALEAAEEEGVVEEGLRDLGDANSGVWTVGEECGLEVRAGACWYGDGGWSVLREGRIDG